MVPTSAVLEPQPDEGDADIVDLRLRHEARERAPAALGDGQSQCWSVSAWWIPSWRIGPPGPRVRAVPAPRSPA